MGTINKKLPLSYIAYSSVVFTSENYRKGPKISDTETICCNYSKIWADWFPNTEMCPKDVDGMANSGDPDLGLHCLHMHDCPKT